MKNWRRDIYVSKGRLSITSDSDSIFQNIPWGLSWRCATGYLSIKKYGVPITSIRTIGSLTSMAWCQHYPYDSRIRQVEGITDKGFALPQKSNTLTYQKTTDYVALKSSGWCEKYSSSRRISRMWKIKIHFATVTAQWWRDKKLRAFSNGILVTSAMFRKWLIINSVQDHRLLKNSLKSAFRERRKIRQK